MDVFLVGLALGVGFGLGAARPTIGIGLLVAVVAPLSSLPWQLGGANLTLPTTYIFALLVGFAARWIGDPRRRDEGLRRLFAVAPVSAALGLLCVTVLLSTALSLARDGFFLLSALPAALRGEMGQLALFNPPGVAGKLQAAWIAVSGPLGFLAATIVLGTERRRTFMCGSFLVGGVITILSPLAQAAFLNPWVRPDRQMNRYGAITGFFQDPHSYAAYLLLAIGFTTSLAFRALISRRGAIAGSWATAAVGGLAALFLSGSRSGLSLGFAVLASTIGIALLVEKRTVEPRDARASGSDSKPLAGTIARGALTALGWTALAVLLLRVGGCEAALIDHVERNRISRTFGSERPTPWRVPRRLELWNAALRGAVQRPLWGMGPKALASGAAVSDDVVTDTHPDNAHNYFLQFGAEYGLPALALLLFALGWLTTRMIAGLTQPRARFVLSGIVAAHLGVVAYCLIAHPLLLTEVQGSYWVLLALGLSVAERSAEH